jgi:hypothetical protein
MFLATQSLPLSEWLPFEPPLPELPLPELPFPLLPSPSVLGDVSLPDLPEWSVPLSPLVNGVPSAPMTEDNLPVPLTAMSSPVVMASTVAD